MSASSEVTVSVERDSITASIEVAAPAERVFELVSSPAEHVRISGDGTVRGSRFGPDQVTAVGEKFGMSMKMFGLPYRMTSTVVEFDPGRVVAWSVGAGQRWRWSVEPIDDERCVVEERFDMSDSKVAAVLRLIGLPKRHERNLTESVRNVARIAEA